MEARSGSSGASPATPATLSDLTKHTREHFEGTMGFEYTEQLLTPENSRSETSSNNDNASTDEKPTLRRRSTRVTRASLRGAAQLEDHLEVDNHGIPTPADEIDRTASGDTLLDGVGVAEGKRSKSTSHLRHSIAVMETALWSETTLPQNNVDGDDHPMAPDTPVSKSSQEPQPGDMSTSLQQRTLRKRVEQALTREDKESTEDAMTASLENRKTLRRSTRLSIVDRASDLVDRASSVLGKRSRDKTEKSTDPGRRASLRPRNFTAPKEAPPVSPPSSPASKKRRVSESDLPSKVQSTEESSQEQPTPAEAVPRLKRKRWLAHGLYTGQEHTDAPPVQSRNRSRRKSQTQTQNPQRKLLPMPMFAGDRLLKQGRDFQLPFDIFSPLPPGQPKPDEWRKTNKNVFVGDASSIWRANKHCELSKCMCTPETGCDEECQNRYMFYECDEGNCGVGPECGNRSFDELKQRTKVGGKYNIGVEVIKTTDRGYGVRSNRTFEPNQIIVEYTGEIITQTECEKRMRTIYKHNECYYLMYFDQNMIIDATRGSIARFVNHSCEPNCRMEKWTVAGKPRMALFAGDRGIMTGEELTYDYNFDPYSQKNVQQCRCGSSNCRGILGPRPKEKDQRAKESKVETQKKARTKRRNSKATGTKRKSGDVLDESPSRANKKRKLTVAKSIKSGVKKAVSRARATVSKATATRTKQVKKAKVTSAKRTAGKATKTATKKVALKKEEAKSKSIKLPKVKATKAKDKTKATVPKKTAAKAKAEKPSATTSKLSRPSAATKAKILAAAKGTAARRRSTKKAEAPGARKVASKATTQTPKPRGATTKRAAAATKGSRK
ncbi:putative histone-lysine N-methyltransferase (Ash1) [Aspergillus ibericus CBS 121593]|uniref:SET domain-containing protein n=1 Tax=Aspergillus ibericus CBS 121593 TaxID=1448316 RepID=A0A395HFC9_9EURO|nr:SET domain-containing protein [Aspergillus ibericus CBS 121593]RAL06430.1 SET domain-containing protein [Aspergillus ibericus CBS 121593]